MKTKKSNCPRRRKPKSPKKAHSPEIRIGQEHDLITGGAGSGVRHRPQEYHGTRESNEVKSVVPFFLFVAVLLFFLSLTTKGCFKNENG